jgi:L-amino acid N-acyltransferase YncA
LLLWRAADFMKSWNHMELAIRDVRPDDAEAVLRILNPIIEARIYTALHQPFTVAEERAFIANAPPRRIWKAAVRSDHGGMLGFQILEPFAAYTAAFDHVATIGTFVDLGLRREGIARRLFSASFAAAANAGFEKLFTFVRADNPAALATYLAQGFTIAGTARDHCRIDGRYIDEVMIEKRLKPQHDRSNDAR